MSRADLFPSVYLRDWKNADRFKTNFTPPRLNFNGFVEFVFNPSISQLINDGISFRTQISSLVQTATLPSVNFNTEIKNQYNIKRIVQTSASFDPVSINVIDTVNNEWLIVFMRYFSYMYMQPKHKTATGTGNNRDLNPKSYASNSATLTRMSKFMADSFESNAAGLNVNANYNFFDQIKLVTYAGGKGVEYILFKPVLTKFDLGDIDYKSSDFRQFSMAFDYENFTINEKVNFNLNSADKARFESYNTVFVSDLLDAATRTKPAYSAKDLEFMGNSSDTEARTPQPKQTASNDSMADSSRSATATQDTQAGPADVPE